jgi:hypothetical protein
MTVWILKQKQYVDWDDLTIFASKLDALDALRCVQIDFPECQVVIEEVEVIN